MKLIETNFELLLTQLNSSRIQKFKSHIVFYLVVFSIHEFFKVLNILTFFLKSKLNLKTNSKLFEW